MKRLSWSKLFTLAALVSLGIVTHGVATAQGPSIQISGSGAGRSPVTTQQVGARVPATQAPGQFKAWLLSFLILDSTSPPLQTESSSSMAKVADPPTLRQAAVHQ